MRIAINILTENPYRPSGALGYYVSLVRELGAIAPEDTFFLLVSPANQHFFPDGVPNLVKVMLPFSNERQKARVLSEHLLIPPVLLRKGIEVLNTGNIAPVWVPGRLVATIKTMHAFTTPGDLPTAMRVYRRYAGRLTAHRADAIVANSQSNKLDITRCFQVPQGKVRVVHEAVDHERFHPVAGKGRILTELENLGVRRPYILFVSSLWRYKNAEVLLRGFRLVRDRFPHHRLVFAGHAPEPDYWRSLQALVRGLGLCESASFIGGVRHQDTAWLYRGAEVLVYPSRYETFGLPVLEAMACGCPVIASNTSSLPEIAGGAAALFDPADERSLADLLAQVLGDATLRGDLVARGLDRARQFSWRKTAEGTLQAFRSVVGRA